LLNTGLHVIYVYTSLLIIVNLNFYKKILKKCLARALALSR